jgi:hypothetical protein
MNIHLLMPSFPTTYPDVCLFVEQETANVFLIKDKTLTIMGFTGT